MKKKTVGGLQLKNKERTKGRDAGTPARLEGVEVDWHSDTLTLAAAIKMCKDNGLVVYEVK